MTLGAPPSRSCICHGAGRANEVAKPLAEFPCGRWNTVSEVAQAVVGHARSLGVHPPSLRQWVRLTTLQRFVLIKLTRDNHDNINFIPAMMEFGLGQSTGQPALAL